MKVIGLTGGIASGKSAVTNILKKRYNYVVIDADQLARQAVELASPGLKKIVEAFGTDVLTEAGDLNRFKLGEIIANDEQARKKLNTIVHPEVQRIYNQEISRYQNQGIPLIFYDCPLLFETHLQNTVDTTIVVVADKEIRINRIMERDGLNREQAQKRIDMQMPDEEKIALADMIIENNGSLDDLQVSLDMYLSNQNHECEEILK